MKNRGFIIIPALLFGTIAVLVVTAFVSWASLNLREVRKVLQKEKALQIAEAGNDYYRWHLAHAPQDFQDGTGIPGPYVHEFRDKDSNVIGNFSLQITPPQTGSTRIAIKSTGTISGDSAANRSVQTELAIPTVAKYSVVSNSDVRFGSGTVVNGPIHSNGGIRFDGFANNIVSSTRNSYIDPDDFQNSFGVHTHVAPPDPTIPPSPLPIPAMPDRPDVFSASRKIGEPGVDFAGFTPDLQQMKTEAQASGVYLANSGQRGYRIVFRNNNTFDLFRVNSLVNPSSYCWFYSTSGGQWGLWTINGQTALGNRAMPANGIIFVEDHVWVEGTINGSRVTVASARFPDLQSTRTSIIVNNNLLYTKYDGTDSIGLIAQQDINVGYGSANDLRIDAAMIAQNGRTGRFYYHSSCGTSYLRNSITLFGMLATNTRYGYSWGCPNYCSGYANRSISYDANLLYNPPPDFPLTSDQYQTISWEEVR